MYNIRPASWYSKNPRFSTFQNWPDFVKALYATEKIHHKTVESANENIFSKNIFNKYNLHYII
jgi:hypothetical protein